VLHGEDVWFVDGAEYTFYVNYSNFLTITGNFHSIFGNKTCFLQEQIRNSFIKGQK
jgi:hypothetical protein